MSKTLRECRSVEEIGEGDKKGVLGGGIPFFKASDFEYMQRTSRGISLPTQTGCTPGRRGKSRIKKGGRVEVQRSGRRRGRKTSRIRNNSREGVLYSRKDSGSISEGYNGAGLRGGERKERESLRGAEAQAGGGSLHSIRKASRRKHLRGSAITCEDRGRNRRGGRPGALSQKKGNNPEMRWPKTDREGEKKKKQRRLSERVHIDNPGSMRAVEGGILHYPLT